MATCKRIWPTFDSPPADFAAFSGRSFRELSEIPESILGDLFLAFACSRNLGGAIRSFRDRYFSVVELSVKRFDGSASFASEVYQRLSEVLFVGGQGSPPKIIRYAGQGTLAGFVATAARRIALRMATNSARFQGESALVHQFSQLQEQETTMLKRQHRDLFNRALSVAVRQLSQRERIILRLNLIERVSTTRIAAMYKVSQPTVSRWIQRSARAIFSSVKELVCDQLEIDTRELESMLLLVRSQIEITISQAGGSGSASDR